MTTCAAGREEEPGVSVKQLLGEIKHLGYQASQNLLYRAWLRA